VCPPAQRSAKTRQAAGVGLYAVDEHGVLFNAQVGRGFCRFCRRRRPGLTQPTNQPTNKPLTTHPPSTLPKAGFAAGVGSYPLDVRREWAVVRLLPRSANES
jgi:hypothetical protein